MVRYALDRRVLLRRFDHDFGLDDDKSRWPTTPDRGQPTPHQPTLDLLITTPILARFQQEREILASLDHPNIAKLLDATTAEGWPYFVMEYVEGKPIHLWCDERKLNICDIIPLESLRKNGFTAPPPNALAPPLPLM